MRQPPSLCHALRFAVVALVVLAVAVALGACDFFGPDQHTVWFCLNPVTGKFGNAPYDANHYVNGVFDPCHCYDPCGPEESCPLVVDAGPPPADAGCDAGNAGDGGP